MSKMNEIDLTVKELRNAAQSLTAVANSLTALFSDNGNNPKVSAEPTTSLQNMKPVTLEEVRAVLVEKSRSGYTDNVRELLVKHGADKLSEIDKSKYRILLEEARMIGSTEGGANG